MALRHDVRRELGAFFADNLFRALSAAGRLHPRSRPARHGVEVIRNLPYLEQGCVEQQLDIYRPRGLARSAPALLYVHGGAFRVLSKETHWGMALAFARRGYVVFTISYRLAPRHPFPAAIADACAAYGWVVRHAHRFGGDPARLILAGESAGANLVTALTIAACYRREEPFARELFDAGVVPVATLPACGMLQVSDARRFLRRKRLSAFVGDRLLEVEEAYLRGVSAIEPGALDLADPLVTLERGEPPARPLPPFFAPVGTHDPLLDDTRRLARALEALGVPCEARYYPGELHAFHALAFRPAARDCWRDTFAFLDRLLAREVLMPDSGQAPSSDPPATRGADSAA